MLIVFNSRVNTNTISHKADGTNSDWSSVDHMVLDLISLDNGTDLQFSTVSAPSTIDFSTNGRLIFALGDQSVPTGKYIVELASIDASNNKTQQMHPDMQQIIFKFS